MRERDPLVSGTEKAIRELNSNSGLKKFYSLCINDLEKNHFFPRIINRTVKALQ